MKKNIVTIFNDITYTQKECTINYSSSGRKVTKGDCWWFCRLFCFFWKSCTLCTLYTNKWSVRHLQLRTTVLVYNFLLFVTFFCNSIVCALCRQQKICFLTCSNIKYALDLRHMSASLRVCSPKWNYER